MRLSNRFGSSPVTFAAATIARRSAGASLEPGTTRTLSFNGAPAVTIPAGAETVAIPRSSASRRFGSCRQRPRAGSERAGHAAPDRPPDFAAAPQAAIKPARRRWRGLGEALATLPFLTDVEVRAPKRVGAVVALGDSITDGFQSGSDLNARYPNFLARRLAFVSAGDPAWRC